MRRLKQPPSVPKLRPQIHMSIKTCPKFPTSQIFKTTAKHPCNSALPILVSLKFQSNQYPPSPRSAQPTHTSFGPSVFDTEMSSRICPPATPGVSGFAVRGPVIAESHVPEVYVLVNSYAKCNIGTSCLHTVKLAIVIHTYISSSTSLARLRLGGVLSC